MAIDGMKAMVLAAGVGSRLDPLTRQQPKPLVPIANRPVMEHILCLLRRHGVSDVISNLHHLPEKVPAYFGDGGDLNVHLQYKTETKLTGDAGGVRACRSHFHGGDTFLVIMGDLVTDADLSYVIQQHKSKGALATIALQKVSDVSRFGVAVLDDDSLITGFQEKPNADEAISDLASTGIYVLEPEIFKYMPLEGELGFGRQLFPRLVAMGLPVLGVQIYGYWSDIGTLADYKRVNFEALDGLMDLDLPGVRTNFGWEGAHSTIAQSCRVEGTLMLGTNSHIEESAVIRGRVIIGDNCRIGRGAILENCIIWSGSDIGQGARIFDAVIGKDCSIAGRSIISHDVAVGPLKLVPHVNRSTAASIKPSRDLSRELAS